MGGLGSFRSCASKVSFRSEDPEHQGYSLDELCDLCKGQSAKVL